MKRHLAPEIDGYVEVQQVKVKSLREDEGLLEPIAELPCLIWDCQAEVYWRRKFAGYTRRATSAGIYTIREAYECTRGATSHDIALEFLPLDGILSAEEISALIAADKCPASNSLEDDFPSR